MNRKQSASKKRTELLENDDENHGAPLETIPLSPPLLFDDEGNLVDPLSLNNRNPLAILSPPQQPKRQPTPFRDASIDRRAKTPHFVEQETRPSNSTTTRRSSLSSLNHSVSPTANRHSSLSQPTTLPHVLSEDYSTSLFGEGIAFDEADEDAVSSVGDSTIQQRERHVSFDIETGLFLSNSPNSAHSDDSVMSPDTIALSPSNDSAASSSRQEERKHLTSLLKTWGMQLNRELIRTSHVTSNELYNILRVARQGLVLRGDDNNEPPSTPSSAELLQDLNYLQHVHRQKVQDLTQVKHDDHFDFALVLQPQAAYQFWADLLDFRAEQLGQEAVSGESDESSPATQGTLETQSSDEPATVPETIDSRPFLTPLTGMRRRRGRFSNDAETPSVVKETPKAPPSSTGHRESGFPYSNSGMIDGSGRRVVKSRLSMFERAVGVSPSMMRLGSKRSLYDNTTTPTPAEHTPVTTSRRRWGNRNIEDTTPMSPPVRALLRRNSSLKKRRADNNSSNSSSSLSARSTSFQENDQVTSTSKRRKKNSIRIEDIPTQVIPRGIAARTNGMMQFLSALKRGIVVRRHRPGAEATFCKVISTDGGDTIKYQHVDDEEAMLALKEQRVRYNHKRFRQSPSSRPRGVEPRSIEKKWSHKQLDGELDEMQTFSLPDFIAAKQYREKLLKDQRGVSKKMNDLATKVANSGVIRVSDIIAVHPARHEDPRSKGELGTASLRRSKSEYYTPHSFSLVMRAARSLGKGKLSNPVASEKWAAGEGTDAQFRTVDLEAATEGEYWLIFRGFLLLHRDAASGRYASHRAAGFGSNYTASADQNPSLETESSSELVLHKDEFREPPTVSYMERLVVRMRKIDPSYMQGYVAPGAVPPPSDYFLGFSSPGTQIWSRLRQAGLDTQRIYALDTQRVMIKVRCPADRLTDVAEVLRLKLKARDGSFVPFRENSLSIYQPLNDALDTPPSLGPAASLFKSSERQTIIDFIIRSRIRDSGAELGQTTDLGKMIAARVPLHMHGKLDSLYNVWFYFWRPCNWEGRDGRSMTVEKADPRLRAQTSSSVPSSSGSALATDNGRDESRNDDKSHDPSNEDPHVVPNFFTRLVVGSLYQPLDSVEQYFGENVAFYFAWLQHSAVHLAFLSVAGLIVFMCQMISGVWDHWIRPVFAMIVMLWSFIVMANWRKRSNYLAHRWGSMNYIEQETTRPQFKGDYRKDEITGEWVVYYPSWKRWIKYLISFPVTLAFTVGTLVLILLVHANRDQLLARYIASLGASGSSEFNIDFSVYSIGKPNPVNGVQITTDLIKDSTFWFLMAGLPALLGLCLPLLNFILMRVSIVLNDFENYRTESEYRTHLIIKVFSFRFVCYFATLYYYAFISTGTVQAIEDGILRVGTGVFIYITVSHWWGVFLQIFFPLSMRKVRLYSQNKQLREELKMIELEESELAAAGPSEDDEETKEKRISLVNRRLLLDQGQDEIWEEIMLPMHNSFPEYIQAVVLFAYVTCFSVVLPITPFICLINHLLSMRLDAYKVCRGRRRPLAHKTGGIGVWEHVLHIVTVIAVLTNCWLMGFTNASISALSASIGTIGLFAIVVGWEHVMLLIKYVMQTSISHLPKSVRDEIKKEEFRLAKKRNSNLRRKNGRRSKLKRDFSRRSTLFDSEERSYLSSKTTQFSSRPSTSSMGRSSPASSRTMPPSSDDRQRRSIPEGSSSIVKQRPVRRSASSSTAKLTQNDTSRTAKRVQPVRRVESPFGSYPSSYTTPPPQLPEESGHQNRNMSGLFCSCLNESPSLSTVSNEDSATRWKEPDDANERIEGRLSRHEENVRSRGHRQDK